MKEGHAGLALALMAERLVATAGRRRVWLAPELPARLLELELRRVATPALAELAVVRASTIGPRGELIGPHDGVGLPGRVWAWFDPSAGDQIVAHAEGSRRGRAERLVCPQGVIEVRKAGLVVVELAKGVSARDLQACSAPPLLIDPEVNEMGFSPRQDVPHDGSHGVA